MEVVVPYNDANFVHNSTIRVSADVEDNSDIPERLIAGQFTRMSLSLDIDDAYLWDTKIRKNVELDIGNVEASQEFPDDVDLDDSMTDNLEGLNVVVHDPNKKFVIEQVYK